MADNCSVSAGKKLMLYSPLRPTFVTLTTSAAITRWTVTLLTALLRRGSGSRCRCGLWLWFGSRCWRGSRCRLFAAVIIIRSFLLVYFENDQSCSGYSNNSSADRYQDEGLPHFCYYTIRRFFCLRSALFIASLCLFIDFCHRAIFGRLCAS